MLAWLAMGTAALLGWALYDSNKPKNGSTPLQNSLSSNPYQIGQSVKVPLNQLPANTFTPTALATFARVGVDGVIVKVKGLLPGAIQGDILSTYGNQGDISLPEAIPITIPNAIISGTA